MKRANSSCSNDSCRASKRVRASRSAAPRASTPHSDLWDIFTGTDTIFFISSHPGVPLTKRAEWDHTWIEQHAMRVTADEAAVGSYAAFRFLRSVHMEVRLIPNQSPALACHSWCLAGLIEWELRGVHEFAALHAYRAVCAMLSAQRPGEEHASEQHWDTSRSVQFYEVVSSRAAVTQLVAAALPPVSRNTRLLSLRLRGDGLPPTEARAWIHVPLVWLPARERVVVLHRRYDRT